MNKRLLQRILFAFASLAAAATLAASTAGAAQRGASRETRDEFFIISSVNVPKHQMVLKLPTEVTVTMKLNDKTSIVSEKGKQLDIGQLRAGDTAYISYVTTVDGSTARNVRLGPMTVQELHRRYLKGYAVPIPPPLPPRLLPSHSRSAKTHQSQTR
jgi:hypothetical protein